MSRCLKVTHTLVLGPFVPFGLAHLFERFRCKRLMQQNAYSSTHADESLT